MVGTFLFLLFQIQGTSSTRTLLQPSEHGQENWHHSPLQSRIILADNTAQMTCAPLANKGTHFTVDIAVGTPKQTFSVVADTGSDAVIVPSCVCRDSGSCGKKDRCFTGTNKSSTFHLTKQEDALHQKGLPLVNMVFGSGTIQAVIATDVVHVGKLHTKMKDGVLLMVDRALQMIGPFEGILGLGQPKNETKLMEQMKAQQKAQEEALKKTLKIRAKSTLGPEGGRITIEDNGDGKTRVKGKIDMGKALKKIIDAMSGGGMEDAMRGIEQEQPHTIQALAMSEPGITSLSEWRWGKKPEAKITPKAAKDSLHYKSSSFLQHAGIKRFSMCFNDEGKDGALILGTPKVEDSMTSIGQMHWGLDFQGFSVGKSTAPVKFCSPKSKAKGQKSACGGIPDSGTTLFMGPEKHIEMLFEEICDSWDRCKTATGSGLQKKKAEVFMLLLNQCGEWMKEDTGLAELPTLHLNLAGAKGEKKVLPLKGTGYVIETMQDEVEMVKGNVLGMEIPMPKKTGNKTKVCTPAFSPSKMETQSNGPIWILGAPLFFEYTVGYDVDEKEPAISFSKGSCGCSNKTSLIGRHARGPSVHMPRQLHGPPRVGQFDLSRGL